MGQALFASGPAHFGPPSRTAAKRSEATIRDPGAASPALAAKFVPGPLGPGSSVASLHPSGMTTVGVQACSLSTVFRPIDVVYDPAFRAFR